MAVYKVKCQDELLSTVLTGCITWAGIYPHSVDEIS